MTELELLELLGELPNQYIVEGQAFRSGEQLVKRTQKRRQLVRRGLSMAAMLAVILAAGLILRSYLSANWVKPVEVVEDESAQTGETFEKVEEVPEEFLAILENRETFSYQDEDITLAEFTELLWERLKNRDCTPVRYALADMDQDGEEELVVRYLLMGEDHELLILDRQETGIIGSEYTGSLPEADWYPMPEAYEDVLYRQPNITLTVTKNVNGQLTESQEDFHIYGSAGWSTYYPEDETWQFMTESMDYSMLNATCIYVDRPEVRFQVVDLGEKTLEDCQQWAKDNYTGQSGDMGADGSVYTIAGGKSVTVEFRRHQTGYYGIIRSYPASETDKLGVYVQIMAQEFWVELDIPTGVIGTWETQANVLGEGTLRYQFNEDLTGTMTTIVNGTVRSKETFTYSLWDNTLDIQFASGTEQSYSYRRDRNALLLSQTQQKMDGKRIVENRWEMELERVLE